ncbi:zinc finger, CCHC-type containing protein, partial [Tanacetum coccineum]
KKKGSPVARISTIRLLTALAATHNLVIHQMDVKTTFLNGDLEEEIYMKQSKGFVMPGYGSVSTLIEACIKLMPHMGKPVNQLEYSRAIGYLMYAMTSTRLNITYTIGKLSRFTSDPSNQEAIIKVFVYLKKIMNYGLSYVGFPSVIEVYSDASWITNSKDHTSTNGWVFLLALGWLLEDIRASKKQTCITNSSMESEFVALAAAGKEARDDNGSGFSQVKLMVELGDAECTLVLASLMPPRQRRGGSREPRPLTGSRGRARCWGPVPRCPRCLFFPSASDTVRASNILPSKRFMSYLIASYSCYPFSHLNLLGFASLSDISLLHRRHWQPSFSRDRRHLSTFY